MLRLQLQLQLPIVKKASDQGIDHTREFDASKTRHSLAQRNNLPSLMDFPQRPTVNFRQITPVA